MRTALDVLTLEHMNDELKRLYLDVLKDLNVAEVARATGRARRTLTAYLAGDRRVTAAAVDELIVYLEGQAKELDQRAQALKKARDREEGAK